MTYLIINDYRNKNFRNIELRNEKHEKIAIKVEFNVFYEIGNFVDVELVNGKYKIMNKVVMPKNFLDYYLHSSTPRGVIESDIQKYIDEIKNDNLKIIVESIIEENPDFYLFPAAKTIHHAYIGGLSEHTLSMLNLAEKMSELYTFDTDIVYSAILLHDLEKVEELAAYGLTYSTKGNLVGHLVMISNEVHYHARTLGIESTEEILNLQHVLLSHHGKLEYGSAREVMTIEAYVVSTIDDFDAKMNYLSKELNCVNQGEFTQQLMGFDRRKFYKKKEGKNEHN